MSSPIPLHCISQETAAAAAALAEAEEEARRLSITEGLQRLSSKPAVLDPAAPSFIPRQPSLPLAL